MEIRFQLNASNKKWDRLNRASSRTEHLSRSFFYEIPSADSTVLKRDGGFALQDAAKMAAREDAKKMKNMRQPDRPQVERIMVGQNAEMATRYRSLFCIHRLNTLPEIIGEI